MEILEKYQELHQDISAKIAVTELQVKQLKETMNRFINLIEKIIINYTTADSMMTERGKILLKGNQQPFVGFSQTFPHTCTPGGTPQSKYHDDKGHLCP